MITMLQRQLLEMAAKERQLFVPADIPGPFGRDAIDEAEKKGLLRYDGSHFNGEFNAWSLTDKGRKALGGTP